MNTKLHPQTFSILPFMVQAKYKEANRDERAKVVLASSKTLEEKIPAIISDALRLSMSDLASPIRTREMAEARAIIVYILRIKTIMTWKAIGNLFNRDHTTAMYGYNVVADQIDVNPEFSIKIERLMRLV
jgi:chromosomal replication initiation ATPase DnaA